MKKKGALDLSINMIVVIIISVIILFAGIALLYQWISWSEETKADLDEQTRQELERLLIGKSQPVALALPVANLYPGEEHIFGIGILNTESDKDKFKLTIGLSKFVDEEGGAFSAEDLGEKKEEIERWLLYDTTYMPPISGHEHRKTAILVSVPADAEKGQYIFNAEVIGGSGLRYGNLQKFTVNIQ